MSVISIQNRFYDVSDKPQYPDAVLQRATSPWVNFPNPNTHRLLLPAATCLFPRSTTTGTKSSPTVSPPLQIHDDGPACIPLPPTPPPKAIPQRLPPQLSHQLRPLALSAPLRLRASSPPSQEVSPTPQSLQSSSRHQLPPDVFHPPPTLPQPSALYPLNPRPQYVPARKAPVPPAEVAQSFNVSATASTLLQEMPATYTGPHPSRTRSMAWTFGIVVFIGGAACLVSGITLVVINARNKSTILDPEKNVDIAAAVLGVSGFSLLCGSAVHLLWLYRLRRRRRVQKDESGDRESQNRVVTASRRSVPVSSKGATGNMLYTGKEQSMADGQEVEGAGATELTPQRSIQSRTDERHQKPRDEAARSPSLITSCESPNPAGASHTRILVKDRAKLGNLDASKYARSGHDRIRSGRTSFLDLDDEVDHVDEKAFDSTPANVVQEGEIKAMQNLESPAGSAHDHQEIRLTPRRQHQLYTSTPLSPARERWRAAQRPKGESPWWDKSFNPWRTHPLGQGADIDQGTDAGVQDLVRYANSFNRLRQDGILHHQRYSSNEPAQEQAVHVPRLASCYRADIANALGPGTKRRGAAQTERPKAKQKEQERTGPGEHGESDGNQAGQSSNSSSHSTSDAGLRELASLAARSSGIPSVSSIPPLPNMSNPVQLGSQRPSPRRRSFGDFQNLYTCRITSPSPVSPTERGPGDLILRIRNAHRRSQSAGRLPLAQEVVASEGAEFTLAPLLPATTYTPSMTRPGAGGIADPRSKPTPVPRADAGSAGLQAGLHARDIARREIVPAIQTQDAAQLVTKHRMPTILDRQVTTLSTASSSYAATPPRVTSAAAAAAAAQPLPTAPGLPINSAQGSRSVELMQNELILAPQMRSLGQRSAGAAQGEKLRPLPYEIETEVEEEDEEEERRESGFVDEGDESWGGGRAEEV